jgi:hypothetical protein
MDPRLKIITQSLDWIHERADDLNERINDYIFYSGCDIDPEKADQKVLRAFDKECEELEVRYDKELRELKKLAGTEE